VWEAIRELGYYPNTQARALVSGKSRMFGLIISDISNPFFPELVKSFEESAISHDFEVIVANTDYESSRMAVCVRRMIERKVDGVAIMTSEIDPHLIEELARRRTPIVFLDLGEVSPLSSNISVDYAKGIKQAVYHLVELGHRRMAFISGPNTLKSARTRRKAFLSCLQACGISGPQRVVMEGNHRVDGGEAAMRKILASGPPPTAVVASNDLTAIGALRALNEAGYRVPQDISLIGFDDIVLSQFTQPPLTTIHLSREELGKKAFEALYYASQHPDSNGRKICLETSLVLRASTDRVKQI
jgi:LacI family transcriptional regulator